MADTRVISVDVGGTTLSVTRAGEGPAVVLLHGFPEIAYSWRHQIDALADLGFCVLAPDQRGYGLSDAPDGVEAYAMTELVGDVIGLLDDQGIDEAVIVGHDWGAIVAPWVWLFRPDRVRALALLSVPYLPRGERSIVDHIGATDPDGDFAYILAFQQPGIEALFEADPIERLRRFHWTVCGARPKDFTRGDQIPEGLPPHLSSADFDTYCRAFERSGYGNPINWYRNMHQNWQASRPWHQAKLACPTLFIGGDRDFVATSSAGALGSGVDSMPQWCTDLRGVHLIEGAGHWVQQEAPDEVNELLAEFLEALG